MRGRPVIVLDLLFPRLCIACGVLLRVGPPTTGWQRFVCRRCGVAATALAPGSCRVHGIDAVVPYDHPWSGALQRFKFSGTYALAGPLGEILASAPVWEGEPRGSPWDGVVAVPLHRRRLLGRGYDQALLLARAAARHHRLPVVPLLRRRRATAPQSRLPAASRADNVAGAFIAGTVRGKRLLLVDDVVTTGATLAEARHTLLQAGAQTVGAVALLRALG